MHGGSVLIFLLTVGAVQAAKDSCFDCVPFENGIHYKNQLSCAACHGDAVIIHKYNSRKPVAQLALHKTGVHAAKPAGNDSAAAACIGFQGRWRFRGFWHGLAMAVKELAD
jgi:hypothetical protein